MATVLEARYARLLRAYPGHYRAERGDEVLGTLMDGARPGQRWPAPREAVHLLLGGLRARTESSGRPLRTVWWHAVHLAVLSALVGSAAIDLLNGTPFNRFDAPLLGSAVLCAAAAVATVLRRYLFAAGAVALAVAVDLLRDITVWWFVSDHLFDVLLVAGLLGLAARRRRDPEPVPRWLNAVVVPLAVPWHLLIIEAAGLAYDERWYGLALVAPVVALLAVPVEPRLSIAVGLWLLAPALLPQVWPDGPRWPVHPLVECAILSVPAILALGTARRLSRL